MEKERGEERGRVEREGSGACRPTDGGTSDNRDVRLDVVVRWIGIWNVDVGARQAASNRSRRPLMD